jgi:adenylyl-sulfate kinase
MKGFTLWFTGLPSSGKSTLAQRVQEILLERGMNVELLDGDEVRTNLCKGLGFSKEDRDTNIRRIGYVCKLLSRNGAVAIAAAISPYRAIRDENRKAIGNYVEVYVKAPIEVLVERDIKGMYKKAIAGELKNFTGISDPYEAPENPEILIESDKETVEESTMKIIRTLELMGLIPGAPAESEYSPEEEEKIKARLKDLGYI